MTKKEVKLFNEGLEEFPVSTIILENTTLLLWILAGSYLCYVFMPIIAYTYLAYGLSMVLVIMRILVCKNCYYHGKKCHTGWGKLSALYTKKGKIEKFGCGAGGAVIPVFYGSMALLPLILAVIVLINNFSIATLITLLVFLPIVYLSSTGFRKKACVQCKMKEICPGSLDKK